MAVTQWSVSVEEALADAGDAPGGDRGPRGVVAGAVEPEAGGALECGEWKPGRASIEIDHAHRAGTFERGRRFELFTPSGVICKEPLSQSNGCNTRPLRSLGSNQVDLGGMISPASAIAINWSRLGGNIENAT